MNMPDKESSKDGGELTSVATCSDPISSPDAPVSNENQSSPTVTNDFPSTKPTILPRTSITPANSHFKNILDFFKRLDPSIFFAFVFGLVYLGHRNSLTRLGRWISILENRVMHTIKMATNTSSL
jgi:hypothetical protein